MKARLRENSKIHMKDMATDWGCTRTPCSRR